MAHGDIRAGVPPKSPNKSLMHDKGREDVMKLKVILPDLCSATFLISKGVKNQSSFKSIKPGSVDLRDHCEILTLEPSELCWTAARRAKRQEAGLPPWGSVYKAHRDTSLRETHTHSRCSTCTGCEVKPSQTSQLKVSHWSCGVSQRQSAQARSLYSCCSQTETDTSNGRQPRSALLCTHRHTDTPTWAPAALIRKRGNWGSLMAGGRWVFWTFLLWDKSFGERLDLCWASAASSTCCCLNFVVSFVTVILSYRG